MLSLEDKIEVNEVAERYGHIVDGREWDKLDSIFVPEASFEFMGISVTNNFSEIRAWLEGLEGQHPGGHLVTDIGLSLGLESISIRFIRLHPGVCKG